MKVQTVKNVLTKLPGSKVFSKIQAALQTTKAFGISSEQSGAVPSNMATREYYSYELEAERIRAEAEELAQRLRQKFI